MINGVEMKADLTKCPECGGAADNGHNRCYPPNAYYCSKCEAKESADAMTTTDTPRTDSEDRWQVDKDELGLTCRETVRIDFARELERECAALREALRELVACQDMHDKIESNDFASYQGYASSCSYYRRRVPLAWSAARALVEKS